MGQFDGMGPGFGGGGGGGNVPATQIQIDVTEVVDGTPTAILFVNPDGTLGDDPNFKFVATADASSANIYSQSNTATQSSSFSLFKQRASSGAVQNGDRLGTFASSGWDGSAYQSNARVQFVVDNTVSSGNVPSAIEFVNSATNSAAATVKMFIQSSGNVGIGYGASSNATGALLDVKAASALSSYKAFRARNSADSANLFEINGDGSFGNANTFIFYSDYLSSGVTALQLSTTNSVGAANFIVVRRARPGNTALQVNDDINCIISQGYDGTDYQTNAAIYTTVDGSVTSGNVPAAFEFNTGSNQGNTLTKMYLNSTGQLAIGFGGRENAAEGLLSVKAASALSTYSVFAVENSSDAPIFVVDGTGRLKMGQNNNTISIGVDALPPGGFMDGNVIIGVEAATGYTGAAFGVVIGYQACNAMVTGDENTVIGAQALLSDDGAGYNVAIGSSAMALSTGSATLNTVVGTYAAAGATNIGDGNTLLGYYSGNSCAGDGNVFLGAYSGYYETGSNKLFIDNQTRTNEATSRTNSMIYGEFNATVTNQILTFNARTIINGRLQTKQGASIAAANNLTLGGDGNVFVITGNTQINGINATNWQAGSVVTLIFTGTPTVKNNTGGTPGNAKLLLAGSVDLVAANNTVLSLVYDSNAAAWQETSRKVA